MAEYVLSCGSTADLTPEHFKRRNIDYICFHYTLDGVSYPDDLGQTIPFEKFYEAMANGAETKTSQINVEEYMEYFEGILKQDKDIFCVCLSSGLSGSYNSACIAAEELREKYPDRKIMVVDSLGASSGYGLFMDKLADLRDSGYSIEQLYDWAIANRLKVHLWFFSTDLTFFIKGGRVSKVSGWFGTVLKICPLLNMSFDGKLVPRFKIRGKSKVITEIVEKMVENAEGGLNYNGKVYLCHSACKEDATAVAELVKEKFKYIDGEPQIYDIGTTIGSHTGPGTVALFFFGTERID